MMLLHVKRKQFDFHYSSALISSLEGLMLIQLLHRWFDNDLMCDTSLVHDMLTEMNEISNVCILVCVLTHCCSVL